VVGRDAGGSGACTNEMYDATASSPVVVSLRRVVYCILLEHGRVGVWGEGVGMTSEVDIACGAAGGSHRPRHVHTPTACRSRALADECLEWLRFWSIAMSDHECGRKNIQIRFWNGSGTNNCVMLVSELGRGVGRAHSCLSAWRLQYPQRVLPWAGSRHCNWYTVIGTWYGGITPLYGASYTGLVAS